MRIYTALLRPDSAPVLVREGFTWGGLVFGPFWLAARGAWVAAAFLLLAWVLALALTPPPLRGPLVLFLAAFAGFCGTDILRWDLARRGYALREVVAAGNEDAALLRLLAARPDLIPATARI